MNCSKCGANVPMGNKFCPNCGTMVQNTNFNQSQNQGFNQGYNNPNQGFNQGFNNPNQGFNQGFNMPNGNLPMNWFKFLIYFALFAGAVFNVIGGIMYLTGEIYNALIYDGAADRIYDFYEELQFIDIIYGIVLIGLGVFAVMTRMKLAAFQREGIAMLDKLYIGALAVMVFYMIATMVILDGADSSAISSNVVAIFVNIAMIAANKQYFAKRAHMFR